MSVSKRGLDLIKGFEGFKDDAYKCSAGKWTVGYGTTSYPCGTPVSRGDSCSLDQANTWLLDYIQKDHQEILKFCIKHRIKLQYQEMDALLSFSYNLGVDRVVNEKSSMSRALMSRNRESIAEAFLLYNKCTVGVWPNRRKIVMKGLDRRRRAEYKLFTSI